jgi:hypothetical protein
MRIAVLFRGPIRPNAGAVSKNIKNLLDQFSDSGDEVHSYLATWKTCRGNNAIDVIAEDLVDNVIMLSPPSARRCAQFYDKINYGEYPASNIFRMYYQSFTALQQIQAAYDYDYIVHTRTDLLINFGQNRLNWLDPLNYVSPPTSTLICDWIGVARAQTMYNAWNYKTLDALGDLIDTTTVPEAVLDRLMKDSNIKRRIETPPEIRLDPERTPMIDNRYDWSKDG